MTVPSDPTPQLILYPGRKGQPEFALRVAGGTVWLSQAEMAQLFGTTTANINIHVRNILKERELPKDSVIKESLITAADGKACSTADEVDTLNRLTVIFLEQAELRVKSGKLLDLEYWRANVDRMLEFNERPVLQGAGQVSHEHMKEIVSQRYEEFDGHRRETERLAADAEDLRALEEAGKSLEALHKNSEKREDA